MASLDWLKLTRQRALSLKKHNGQKERLEYNHSNPDIDKTKTDQNYCIGCADYDDAVDAMIKRVKEVDELYPQKTKSERKDRKVALSIEAKCPQEIYDSGRSREFFEKTHQLLSDFFSAENNLGSCIHLDEMHRYLDKDGTEKMSLAHMTTLIAAYTEWKDKNGETRRGISASKLESRANLNKLNKAMCDMVRREFGVEYNTGEQARHETVEHLKAESKLAELKQEIETCKGDLDLIKQAGDKAFAELSKNLDEAKSIGVQQLKEISEEGVALQRKNDEFVRSLEPTTTKTEKGIFFGKTKEVPKTEEEVQREREVKAAQAILKREDEVDKRERNVAEQEQRKAREKSEIEADRQAMNDYLSEREADFKGKEAKMRESFQQQLNDQAAEFTGQITKLETENLSLRGQVQRQAKSFANAVAIRARTLLEKTLRGMGLPLKSEYTVDAQMRTVQQQLQQHQMNQQKGR